MTLVRWQPRNLLRTAPAREYADEMDRLLDWAFGGMDLAGRTGAMVPAMDVFEEDGRYVVRADLPGLSKDEVEITYQDGVLTLKGEKKETREARNDRVYHRERFVGKFGRNLQLPQKVDVEKIEANFKDGVLELVLPFTPDAQPRKIQINK